MVSPGPAEADDGDRFTQPRGGECVPVAGVNHQRRPDDEERVRCRQRSRRLGMPPGRDVFTEEHHVGFDDAATPEAVRDPKPGEVMTVEIGIAVGANRRRQTTPTRVQLLKPFLPLLP